MIKLLINISFTRKRTNIINVTYNLERKLLATQQIQSPLQIIYMGQKHPSLYGVDDVYAETWGFLCFAPGLGGLFGGFFPGSFFRFGRATALECQLGYARFVQVP